MRPRALDAFLSIFVAIMVASAAPLFAATVDARALSFLPLRYSPGEEVVAQGRAVLDPAESPVEFDLKRGSGLPEQRDGADPELRELRLSRAASGWTLTWTFVPWSPGAGRLPSMRERGISIPALRYEAVSVIGPEDRDPSAPRPQFAPPGTALFLYGLGGSLIILMAGAAATALYLVPAARALIARRRAAQAFARFSRSLDYIARNREADDPAVGFAALSRALRLYLAARGLPDAPTLTASEVAALPDDALAAHGTTPETAALLGYSDLIRFGRPGPEPREARAALATGIAQARAIGQAIEEAYLARL